MSYISSQANTVYSAISYRRELLRVDKAVSQMRREALEADLGSMRRTVAEIVSSVRTDAEKISALEGCIRRMNVEQIGLA